MSGAILILRPEPGAAATAARARALGLEPVVAPLFEISPRAWDAPDPADFDAVLLTSAHAARFGGEQLGRFGALTCYAVGDATAAAAAEAGFGDVRTGSADGASLLEMAAREGAGRLLHLCGRDRIALDDPQVKLTSRVVYAADTVDTLPAAARAALEGGAIALLHSPRAALVFRTLLGEAGIERRSLSIAAISASAAAAAGAGWKRVASAREPRDAALLELACELCNSGGEMRTGR